MQWTGVLCLQFTWLWSQQCWTICYRGQRLLCFILILSFVEQAIRLGSIHILDYLSKWGLQTKFCYANRVPSLDGCSVLMSKQLWQSAYFLIDQSTILWFSCHFLSYHKWSNCLMEQFNPRICENSCEIFQTWNIFFPNFKSCETKPLITNSFLPFLLIWMKLFVLKFLLYILKTLSSFDNKIDQYIWSNNIDCVLQCKLDFRSVNDTVTDRK